eukprot:81964-Amorphochlora_amoeboformis.AAC.1
MEYNIMKYDAYTCPTTVPRQLQIRLPALSERIMTKRGLALQIRVSRVRKALITTWRDRVGASRAQLRPSPNLAPSLANARAKIESSPHSMRPVSARMATHTQIRPA